MPHHPWEVNVRIWNRHIILISDNSRIRIAIPCREGEEDKKMTIQKSIFDKSNKQAVENRNEYVK
jgi:hypothetical protein